MLHFEDRTGLPYQGPDRRRGNDRRLSGGRRCEIRFELDKDGRRNGKERRRQGGSPALPRTSPRQYTRASTRNGSKDTA